MLAIRTFSLSPSLMTRMSTGMVFWTVVALPSSSLIVKVSG